MIRIFGSLLLITCLFSCDSTRVYEVNNELADQVWLADSVQQFRFNIYDTLLEYNLLCNIRNSNSYPFRNIYVQYSLADTTGKVMSSGLINYELFDASTGKPLGNGFGDVYDHSFFLTEKVAFPYKGEYDLSITQYMRRDTLPDVLSVGLRVEQSTPE
jgi:gliding motility-associated lipoprotein GldH